VLLGATGGGVAVVWGRGAAQAPSKSVASRVPTTTGLVIGIAYSETLAAKCVPRTPMVATGVTKVADPGARRLMSPET